MADYIKSTATARARKSKQYFQKQHRTVIQAYVCMYGLERTSSVPCFQVVLLACEQVCWLLFFQ